MAVRGDDESYPVAPLEHLNVFADLAR